MRGDEVVFIAAFDKAVILKISSPNGAGGSTYHLMFDNYYKGIIVDRGEWNVRLQVYNPQFTQANFDVLIEKLIANIISEP